jgi:hypothetical protein
MAAELPSVYSFRLWLAMRKQPPSSGSPRDPFCGYCRSAVQTCLVKDAAASIAGRKPNSLATPPVPIALVLVFALFSSGCWFNRHPPAAFTPPPPQAAPVAAEPERLPEPPLVASVPDLSDSPADPSTAPGGLIPNGVAEAPAPPAPGPPSRRPPVSAPPKPVATAPRPDPQPPPRLGQILSPEQTREYNHTLEESLDRVRKVLAVLTKKNLSPDQAEILNRIQVFQKQAEEARVERDLVKAVSLARRADVLAKDLQDHVP